MKSLPQSTHLIRRSWKSDVGDAALGRNVGSEDLPTSHVSSNSLRLLRSLSDIYTSECVLEDLDWLLEDEQI